MTTKKDKKLKIEAEADQQKEEEFNLYSNFEKQHLTKLKKSYGNFKGKLGDINKAIFGRTKRRLQRFY